VSMERQWTITKLRDLLHEDAPRCYEEIKAIEAEARRRGVQPCEMLANV